MLLATIPAVWCLPLRQQLRSFGPLIQPDFEVFTEPVDVLMVLDPGNPVEIAKSHFSDFPDLVVTDSYKSSATNVYHVYLKQIFNGLEIANGVGNVNILDGRVISSGNSFYKPQELLYFQSDSDPTHLETPRLSNAEALSKLLEFVGFDAYRLSFISFDSTNSNLRHSKVSSDIQTSLCYLMNAQRTRLTLVWSLIVDLNQNWLHAHVDASNGRVESLVDWVSHSSYEVYPFGVNDPSEGTRAIVNDPEIKKASPIGWNARQVGKKIVSYNGTIGNNVFAQNNPTGGDKYLKNYRPDGGKGHQFVFPIDFAKEPDSYADAAITNLFYYNNVLHDLFYLYGFDEKSGNFQDSNFQKGGKGNDAVIANAQDGSGKNNANFATPPDGQHARMRMYVWNQASPQRDGDLESGIIIHEYAHGISTRLTGGPANSNCLGWGESGGMGEGWGDIFATIFRMNKRTTKETNFSIGSYSATKGIRRYEYSTSNATNPETYGLVKKYWEVHDKGEIWAEILFEVYWSMVEKNGWEENWFDLSGPEGYPSSGNKLFLILLIEGMKLQPCYPTFVDARDAILSADTIITQGNNQCCLWKGFAKRGLGVGAAAGGAESFLIPKRCE
jgi:extracellular elastinolytic metalloproteinase